MTVDPVKITVVGLGGVGSWCADGLARMLNAQAPGSTLQFVDGDGFEEKNSERQNFKSFGNKAQAVRKDLRDVVPNVFIIAKAAWLVDADHANDDGDDDDEGGIAKITPQSITDEGDIIVCVVDNHAARKLVCDAAREYENIDVLLGGNGSPEEGNALFGSVYHYQRRNGVDITAHPADYHSEIEDPQDRNTGELSCQERAELDGGTQLVAVNMAVAAALLGKLSLLVFGTEEEKAEAVDQAAEVYFDLGKGKALPYERKPTVAAPVTV